MNSSEENKILWDNAGLIHKVVKATDNAAEIPQLEEALKKLTGQHGLTVAIHAIVSGERVLSEFVHIDETEKVIIAAILRSIASRELDALLSRANDTYNRGMVEESIALHSEIIQQYSDCWMAYFSRGSAFSRQGRFKYAIDDLNASIRIHPQHADAHCALAAAYLHWDKPDDAMRCCEEAIRLNPRHDTAPALKATIQIFLGKFEQANDSIEPLIDSGTNNVEIVLAYASLATKLDKESKAIAALKRILEIKGLSAPQRQRLHIHLGQLLDSTHDYANAFNHLQQGNDLKPEKFDRISHAEAIAQQLRVFNTDSTATFPRSTIQSERPIFIVGMPRSGTTLIEQIIASHPLAHGAGELGQITLIAESAARNFGISQTYPSCIALLDEEKLSSMASNYLSHLNSINSEALRVIDKLPGNFMHLGLISLLFPGARIIHAMRDARDTCLSCYLQDFAVSNEFASSLEDLGFYYNSYKTLMAHWEKTLSLPILNINYEDLVADQGKYSRQLIEFCGLEWDDQCLQYHKTSRFVGTASYAQVRTKMYSSSVKRWENYRQELVPLFAALEE